MLEFVSVANNYFSNVVIKYDVAACTLVKTSSLVMKKKDLGSLHTFIIFQDGEV